MSKIIILILSFLIANADTFNFTELRYSDALNKTMELNGEISFFQNGLSIKYKKSKKSLHLQDGILIYKEDGEQIAMNETQAQRVTQYFEIILLLHSGDKELLESMFEVDNSSQRAVLRPKGSLSHFVTFIELRKHEDKPKEIKLFLSNSDNIIIKINDEIR